ncbi:MAG: DUF928 domain-containing protein [Spirulinaceae cyanobacterium]
MRKIKSRIGKLSLALSLELAMVAGFCAPQTPAFEPSGEISTPQRTQPGGTRVSIPTQWEPNRYRPPGNISRPRRTQQGGTRRVEEEEFLLKAIVPESSQGFGTTSQPYPTFLVFVADLIEERDTIPVEFVLIDEDGNDVYRASFSIKTESQLLSLTLPAHAGMPPLEVGKNYRWSLMLVQSALDWTHNPTASGWVTRVEPSIELTQALSGATSAQEQATIYAHEEIWYDAAATLAQLQRESPQNEAVSQDWVKLLKAAGLESISSVRVSFN